MAEPNPIRSQLAKELLRLRDLAGMSGRDMARRTGVSQPTMSRIDRGLALPSMHVVRTWLDACNTDSDTRERVEALAEAAHGETRPWRTLFGELTHLQAQARERDAAAAVIRNFQPTVLPGLLQTAAYARAVLELGRSKDVAAALVARLERQQVLHEPGRRFEFVLAEHVLRWSPAPGALAGQLDRLQSLATASAVEIAILPDTVSAGAVPWHNFVIRDAADGGTTTVSTELIHGAQDDIAEPGVVEVYVTLWERLWNAAAHGDEALELIRRLA
ncbi:helix-turn-helix transcriptional regulator [Pseudonocardia sp. MH-G8]|uniref:helix-turn-helix domain-containing protein n=1 Tax=Pseudonocardia sp. MH-G8 TaxID=1854588 RepID=UPI000BA0A04D|nr:helix-turn-helix transcriptional regulator [Pseudonocardia sp. MH-G8]OZM82629.1 transcriptional regulator [Pseudonocardia sp. MH-G8]